MTEIRFHGRGGQGAVLAAKILAKALAHEGKFVKAVPSFGFERRGAPVASFLRFDERQIRQTTNIYTPDWIVCIDPTLYRTVNIFEGVRAPGVLVQTTAKPLEALGVPPEIRTAGLCDAVRIASEVLGRPITNTIMLGALLKTTGVVSMDALVEALSESSFRDAALGKNLEAVRRGYDETAVHRLHQDAP